MNRPNLNIVIVDNNVKYFDILYYTELDVLPGVSNFLRVVLMTTINL